MAGNKTDDSEETPERSLGATEFEAPPTTRAPIQSEQFKQWLRAAYALELTSGLMLEEAARRCSRRPTLHLSLLHHLHTTNSHARGLRQVLEEKVVPLGSATTQCGGKNSPAQSRADVMTALQVERLKNTFYSQLIDMAREAGADSLVAQLSEYVADQEAIIERLEASLERAPSLGP